MQTSNTGQVDANVEHSRKTLVGLREKFHAAGTVGAIVPQAGSDVVTQETEMSDEASKAGASL